MECGFGLVLIRCVAVGLILNFVFPRVLIDNTKNHRLVDAVEPLLPSMSKKCELYPTQLPYLPMSSQNGREARNFLVKLKRAKTSQ